MMPPCGTTPDVSWGRTAESTGCPSGTARTSRAVVAVARTLQERVQRELLRWEVGKAIFCQRHDCGAVLDVQRAVSLSIGGTTTVVCSRCWAMVRSAVLADLKHIPSNRYTLLIGPDLFRANPTPVSTERS